MSQEDTFLGSSAVLTPNWQFLDYATIAFSERCAKFPHTQCKTAMRAAESSEPINCNDCCRTLLEQLK